MRLKVSENLRTASLNLKPNGSYTRKGKRVTKVQCPLQQAEVESWRTSLASRTHFEILSLGLKSQVLGLGIESQVLSLGLEPYKSSKMSCPRLENSIVFWLVESKIIKLKNFLNSVIGVARICDGGGPKRKISCNMTSSETFKRGDFLWDKNVLEWKLINLEPWLVR